MNDARQLRNGTKLDLFLILIIAALSGQLVYALQGLAVLVVTVLCGYTLVSTVPLIRRDRGFAVVNTILIAILAAVVFGTTLATYVVLNYPTLFGNGLPRSP